MRWFGSIQYCKVRPKAWGDERLDVSLAPPAVLGSRGRALCFSTKAATTSIELAMLQVSSRGNCCTPNIVEIGFALLRKTDGTARHGTATMAINGEQQELVTASERNQRGCVAIEMELPPGEYTLLPLVLSGRRAARALSNQDRATLALFAQPPVDRTQALDGLPAGAVLRDATLLRALEWGESHTRTSEGAEIRVLKEPCGHSIVAINVSRRYPLRVSLWADKSLRVEGSRSTLRTLDVVPPGHAQVLQVFTFSAVHSGPKKLNWSSRISTDAPGCSERHEPGTDNCGLHETVPWPLLSASR